MKNILDKSIDTCSTGIFILKEKVILVSKYKTVEMPLYHIIDLSFPLLLFLYYQLIKMDDLNEKLSRQKIIHR